MSILADRDDDNPFSWLPQPQRSLGQGSCDVQIGTKYRLSLGLPQSNLSPNAFLRSHLADTCSEWITPALSYSALLSALVVPQALGAMKCLPKWKLISCS